MKLKAFFVSLVFLSITAFGFETIRACSCVERKTCEYSSSASIVFTGKVIDSIEKEKTVKRRVQPIGSREWEDDEYVEKRQISRLQVEEAFFGASGQKEILIETEISSSCALPLLQGVSYLIYANQNAQEENLMTYFCSGTRPVSSAQEDISYLRANKDKSAVVSGKTGFGGWSRLNPSKLSGYGVTTVNLENQVNKFQASIGSDGSYKFSSVPPGTYKIRINLPDFLTSADEYNPSVAEELGIGDQSELKIPEHGCRQKDFLLQENGRISGRITDAQGKPVEDITVYLIPVSATNQKIKQEEECYDNNLCLDTDENGNYSFKGLNAGRYLVGVRLDSYVGNDSVDAAYLKTYYPGAATEKAGAPVTVRFGKLTGNIDFKLTRKYKEREIKGRVYLKDGRPAAKANVRYVARTPDFKENGITFIKTDENGYFSITGYENHSYLIGAFSDDGADRAQAFAVVVDVLPHKNLREIKLILNRGADEECEKCGKYFDFLDFPKNKPRGK